jgi:hypothetical protein
MQRFRNGSLPFLHRCIYRHIPSTLLVASKLKRASFQMDFCAWAGQYGWMHWMVTEWMRGFCCGLLLPLNTMSRSCNGEEISGLRFQDFVLRFGFPENRGKEPNHGFGFVTYFSEYISIEII